MITLVWLPREPGSRHGHVCVKDVSFRHDFPEKLTIYWPASKEGYSEYAFMVYPELKDGAEVELHRSDLGTYSYRRFNGDWVEVRLLDGGQTLAVRHTTEPVPPPKVRAGIEIEWRYGRWMKLLRKGWVPA
jgi:hypothetical protein